MYKGDCCEKKTLRRIRVGSFIRPVDYSGARNVNFLRLAGKGKPRRGIESNAHSRSARTLEVMEDLGMSLREEKMSGSIGATQISPARIGSFDFSEFIGISPALRPVYDTIARLSDIDSSVLILGESGSGKELVARALHSNSPRRGKPMITVNCGAIPKELLESELFGHERGSFTGAMRSRPGKFEQANGGTVFLDEIGDMDPALQVKLLRALQEREIERVGGAKPIPVDIRIIAATNQDLEEAIAERRFREDLYYRLNVVPIRIPPLRERLEDIPLLIGSFIELFNSRLNRRIAGMRAETVRLCQGYGWPGNVRELKHLIERIVALKGCGLIEPSDLPARVLERSEMGRLDLGRGKETSEIFTESSPDFIAFDQPEEMETELIFSGSSASARAPERTDPFGAALVLPEGGLDLKEALDKIETELILAALDRSGGVKNRAAALLKLNRTTLVEKIKKKNLARAKLT